MSAPITPPGITFSIRETTFVTGFGEWTYGLSSKTAKRCWSIQCSQQPTYADIDSAKASLPVNVGDQYAAGDSRYCEKITVKAVAGDLDSLYAEAEFGPNQYQENPLTRPDKLSLQVGSETESWFVDTAGKPTVTSAGEILDKVPPRTTGGVKLVITGNRSTLPAAAMIGLSRPNTINTSGFTVGGISIGAKQAKLSACSGDETTENGVTFYTVKWELSLSPDWTLKLDDRGYFYKDAGVLKPITSGEPPTQVKKPWPLDGSGGKKANASDAPAQLSFMPYTLGSFSFGWTA